MHDMLNRARRGARLTFASALSGAMVLAAPAFGVAQSASPVPTPVASTGPISMATCELASAKSGYGMGNLTVFGHQTNFFRVVFTNTATVSADRITFQIDFGKSRITIGDAGSYAPNTSVTQIFREKGKDISEVARPGGDGPIACTVISAHFMDGTTWAGPVATPPNFAPTEKKVF